MEGLKAFIEKVDDDYLTGLSNKGTVKRAYRDLDQETFTLTLKGEEAQIALREETCTLRMPLGESSCSCPSHSMCRHILTAVLWMKRQLSEGAAAENVSDKQLEEVLLIPPLRLIRACGNRRFEQFLAHMYAEELPPVEESSVVTVRLPWETATVKLLEPFAYTACTCHSKELCPHKAQAVLAYQIEKGKLTLKELEALREPETAPDKELVRTACESICEELCHQLCTGLSRQSGEAEESLTRLAILAHRAELPNLESALREAGGYYGQYFSRSAVFRSGELMEKILTLYETASKLSKTEDTGEIRRLAGNFRDAYMPVGKLRLVGMGARSFSSRTGYEGEIYYFLETAQRKWYTWTDARPTFYEGRSMRKPPTRSAPAPWNLNCNREQLQSLVFELQGAKAAAGGRLSVSQESRGEAQGVRSRDLDEMEEMIRWDYEKMVRDYFEQKEPLVLAGAVRWEESFFDKVSQRFFWNIYDERERRLSISLKYTKEEGLIINLLERLEQRLRRNPPKALVFFGSLYTDEEGKICLYPIEFFVRDEKNSEPAETFSEELSANSENSEELPSREILDSMKQYCGEVLGLLGDLFVSGLNSVQEEILSLLERLGQEGEQMGLHRGSRDLSELYRLLKGRRHQLEFEPEPVIGALGRLKTYFNACMEKINRDRVFLMMREQQDCFN